MKRLAFGAVTSGARTAVRDMHARVGQPQPAADATDSWRMRNSFRLQTPLPTWVNEQMQPIRAQQQAKMLEQEPHRPLQLPQSRSLRIEMPVDCIDLRHATRF